MVASKHVERGLASLVIKEEQMNTTKIHTCIPIRLAEINKFDRVKCQRRCGSINVHTLLVGENNTWESNYFVNICISSDIIISLLAVFSWTVVLKLLGHRIPLYF